MKTHTGEKPFKCRECHYVSFSSSDLQKHMIIHPGEKPFRCITCEKTCAHSNHLKQHIATHTGEKPFRCMEFENTFARSFHQKKHLKIHTGEITVQVTRMLLHMHLIEYDSEACENSYRRTTFQVQ